MLTEDQKSDQSLEQQIESLSGKMVDLRAEISKAIVGQSEVVEGVLIALLAGAHVLLEGVPGVGKTLLVRTLAQAVSLKYSRIQFTPDLMPADVIGTSVVQDDGDGKKVLDFQPGPIFTNLLLADEINRTTPKTQSALLEAMQEKQVTVGPHHAHAGRTLFRDGHAESRSRWKARTRFPKRNWTVFFSSCASHFQAARNFTKFWTAPREARVRRCATY